MTGPESRPEIVSTVTKSGVTEIGPLGEAERVVKRAVFVDATNYYLAFRKLLSDTDTLGIDRLFDFLSNNGQDTMKVSYYSSDPNIHPGFLELLRRRRVTVKIVPRKIIKGKEKEGPVDMLIASDMIDQRDTYEEAVLLSGDGDYFPPVERLLARGKKVRVISSWAAIGKEILASGAKVSFWEELLPQLTIPGKPKNEQTP